jgi:heme/copper-type cytochrome/quinol oxidase subunit 2
MPIKVIAVTPEEFDAWVKEAQGKYDKIEEPAPAASNEPASAAPAKSDGSSALASATQVQSAN